MQTPIGNERALTDWKWRVSRYFLGGYEAAEAEVEAGAASASFTSV